MTTSTPDTKEESKKELLRINNDIVLIKSFIQAARRRSYLGLLLLIIGLIGCLVYVADFLVLDWKGLPPYPKHAAALAFLAIFIWGIFIKVFPGVHLDRFPKSLREKMRLTGIGQDRRTAAQLELELQAFRDEKRTKSDALQLTVEERRAAYKEDALVYVEELRRESNLYRKVSHTFQGIVISGSAFGTLGAGTTYFISQVSWGVATANLLVAIASGFGGYYKYKERGFYAQQTADAIEHELEAYELGVGRYKAIPKEKERLMAFSEEIHRLRQDQKMREQNLDQPSSSTEEAAN